MKPIERVLNAIEVKTGKPAQKSGQGWKCCCPAHDDHNPSLSVSEGDDGKVLTNCLSRGCQFADIAEAVGLKETDFFPVSPTNPARSTSRTTGSNKPMPSKPGKSFSDPKAAIKSLEAKLGPRSSAWDFHDHNGQRVGVVVRWDTLDGHKEFRPISRRGDAWVIEAMAEPRPLYRLSELSTKPADVVVVVEGETCADAANSLGFLAVTSSGGSSAAAKTDWSPLAGRKVILIPDHDEPGCKYARDVADILTQLDPPAIVKVIDLINDWPELPDAGDIVDWLDAHDACEPTTLRERIERLAMNAPDFQTEMHQPAASTVGNSDRLHDTEPDAFDWPEPKPLPKELLTVEAFEPTLLPESFRGWIDDIAERLQCPIDFPAVASMIVLAGIVGRKVGIRPKRHDDWLVIPNLWGMVISRSGIMKSPALNEPLNVLKRLEIDAKQAFDQQRGEHKAAILLADVNKKRREDDLKKAAKNDAGLAQQIAAEIVALDDVPQPVRRRYLVNDGTVEKLGEILNENPNGVTIFRDELISLLKSLDKDGQEGARGFYLTAWNGDSRYTYDRIGRGTLDIAAACVSLMGGIQPGPLGEYLRAAVKGTAGDDGLLQRFQLMVWPEASKSWRNVDRFPDTTAKQRAFETCERLDALDVASIGTELSESDSQPFLKFDADAQDVFDDWREKLELRLRSDGEHPAIESHLSKYRSLVPSLALLIHLADEPDGGPVSATATLKAVAWASYLESHARRIYGAVSHRASAGAKALANKLLKGELSSSFALRDVYRNGWTHLGTREEVDEAVNALLDLDWLREVREPQEVGRTPTRYILNPKTTGMTPGKH